MAWYAHGGGNGRPWGAVRIAMPSPQMPDCRGGVFAVFAKIPPPTAPRPRHHISLREPCEHTSKMVSCPLGTGLRAIPHPGPTRCATFAA